MTDILSIAAFFATEGEAAVVKPLGEGFINDTYTVFLKDRTTPDYILQRKNHIVFPDVPAMMDNINRVSRHIRAKVSDPLRETLTVIPTKDGKLYYKDSDGNFWAMCLFIKDSMSFDRADSPDRAYQGGLGLGTFHRQVADFDGSLTEIIKGFHNIRWRFKQWDASLERNAAGRVRELGNEISWIESRREKMLSFWKLYEDGTIPVRVTHGDTKISNFLFDSRSGRLLCAIDLDTMMSSTLLNDTGDALRSYTNTGAEDDPDLGKVSMSMDMFEAYMKGYLKEMKELLAPAELEYLAFSGIYITYEQVLRFLMDYIDGDTYYKIKSPDHNLVRTRAQYKLLTSMEEQLLEMERKISFF
ncbi:MAG: aminoglycoside phosphotransferase family protein [Bacteroidales bacterium]|nr:aminoglycoside phosphotransferase family protein [Bacteroidales bacterium]